MQVVCRAETNDAALVLGQPVHPGAGGAVEGHLGAVAEKKILAEVFAQLLEEVAQVADDGVIAQDGVLLLGDVLHVPVGHQQRDDQRDENTEDDAEHASPVTG